MNDKHTDTTARDLELIKVIREALRHWEEADDWWDDDAEYLSTSDVERALAGFMSAAQLAPDEPWIWFQIGWCSLALEDVEKARAAFQRVLMLDPDNVCAHFALAYLLLEFGPFPFDEEFSLLERDPAAVANELMERALREGIEESELKDLVQLVSQPEYQARRNDYQARVKETIWRQHLQAALSTGFYWHDFSASSTIAGSEFKYYNADLGVSLFLKHLEALGEVVPEDLRADYYNGIGISLEGHLGWSMGEAHEWFERAIRWESGNPEALFYAHINFSAGFYDVKPPDYLAVCQALSRAYSYLMETQDPADAYDRWLMDVGYLVEKWQPGDDLPDLLSLCDAVLDLRPFGGRLPKRVSGADVAPVAEAAGALLVERGDLARAEPYFLQAKELDPTRVSVARRLSELYIDQQRWSEALAEQQRAARLAPADPDAQRLVVVLAVATTAAKSGLKPELEAIHNGIAKLQAGQDLIISLQRDLLQQVSDGQRRAQLALRHASDATATERVYADLIDQLHNLVQQGPRVQMAAVQVAKNRLIEVLGYEYFSALLPECQHFLVTAETFYATSADIPEQLDAALIAVEYAKVVETELRRRFMAKLGNFLDACQYTGELVIYEYGKGRRPKRGDKWEKWITSHSFSLGYIGGLLQMTVEHNQNPEVMDYISKLGLEPEEMNRLAKDIETITKRYRNGAAHTEGLGRLELDEFRDLLFEKGLLNRLVDLGIRAERYS